MINLARNHVTFMDIHLCRSVFFKHVPVLGHITALSKHTQGYLNFNIIFCKCWEDIVVTRHCFVPRGYLWPSQHGCMTQIRLAVSESLLKCQHATWNWARLDVFSFCHKLWLISFWTAQATFSKRFWETVLGNTFLERSYIYMCN